MVSLLLDEGLQEIVWRWDTPEAKTPEKPERPVDQVAEFRSRFAEFCTDVGIVPPDGKPLPMEGDVPHRQYVRVAVASREWERIRELNHALTQEVVPRQVVADLLVLEVPGKLARQWGLDGLPPGGPTPPLFADGVPSVLEPEGYSVLCSLILGQPGTRVFAMASVTTLSGKTAVARQVTQVSYNEGLVEREPEAPATGEDTKQVALSEYCVGAPRDVGLVFEVTPSPPSLDGWLSRIDVSIRITGIDSWVEYDAGNHVRTPCVWRFSVETGVACTMGQTILLAGAYQTGEAYARVSGTTPRNSCLLALLSPRWSPAVPQLPKPEDYTSPAGELLVPYRPLLSFLTGKGRRWTGGIDWGDDDDDDDDEGTGGIDWGGDDDDDDEDEDSKAKADTDVDLDAARALKVRQFFASLGAEFGTEGKVVCRGAAVVLFGSSVSIERARRIVSEVCCMGPRPMLCRAAALRVSPGLWLKLSQDQGPVPSRSTQPLSRADAQAILREVARDKDSRIVTAASVCTSSSKTAVLGDAMELLAPETYEQRRVGGHAVWLPRLGEARDIGARLEVTPTLGADQRQVTLELSPSYTEFAGWQPLGTTRGLPQYRETTIETQVLLQCGQYLLLGGGGVPGAQDNPIIWLIGVDRMGW